MHLHRGTGLKGAPVAKEKMHTVFDLSRDVHEVTQDQVGVITASTDN